MPSPMRGHSHGYRGYGLPSKNISESLRRKIDPPKAPAHPGKQIRIEPAMLARVKCAVGMTTRAARSASGTGMPTNKTHRHGRAGRKNPRNMVTAVTARAESRGSGSAMVSTMTCSAPQARPRSRAKSPKATGKRSGLEDDMAGIFLAQRLYRLRGSRTTARRLFAGVSYSYL